MLPSDMMYNVAVVIDFAGIAANQLMNQQIASIPKLGRTSWTNFEEHHLRQTLSGCESILADVRVVERQYKKQVVAIT